MNVNGAPLQGEMVDYAICLESDSTESMFNSMRSTMQLESTTSQYINHTSFEPVRFRPIAVSIKMIFLIVMPWPGNPPPLQAATVSSILLCLPYALSLTSFYKNPPLPPSLTCTSFLPSLLPLPVLRTSDDLSHPFPSQRLPHFCTASPSSLLPSPITNHQSPSPHSLTQGSSCLMNVFESLS